MGVEIDAEAVATSVRNAGENGLGERFDAMLPEGETEGVTYPLVVANILAGTLVQLQPVLAARVAPRGALLLSGIWGDEQAASVRAAYAAAFEVEEAQTKDDWYCIRLTRRE